LEEEENHEFNHHIPEKKLEFDVDVKLDELGYIICTTNSC
jgi:hypothetical protein